MAILPFDPPPQKRTEAQGQVVCVRDLGEIPDVVARAAWQDGRVTYLAQLDAALVGPRRAKRDLLQEAADHLEDATDALVEAGWPAGEARARAESEFGPVREIAEAYQTTLAVAASRRTALILAVVLVFQPFLWDEGVNLAGLADKGSAPGTWWYAALNEAIELGGFAMLVAAVGGLVAVTVGNRWVHAGRRLARGTAILTFACSLLLPAMAVGMLAGSSSPVSLWLFAGLLLMLPLLAAVVSAWRTMVATAPPVPVVVAATAQSA